MLSTYQKKLIGLDHSNKQLLLLKIYRRQCIDLASFGYLYDQRNAFSLIENLLKGVSKQKLCPRLDSFFTSPNALSHELEDLYERDKILKEEQGTQELKIGYLMVEGKFLNNQIVRAPLLFFKVKLSKTADDWVLESKSYMRFNQSFLLAYAYYNKQKLGDDVFNYDFKNLDFENGLTFLTRLYELIKHLGLKLDFNSQTFECEILTFKNQTKLNYQNDFEQGQLRLQHYAILGLFNQTYAYFIRDYDYLLKHYSQTTLESLFFKDRIPQNNVAKTIATVSEKEIYTPFPTDIWQQNALKLAKKGFSYVVQGPPGSGKSQLICNLILNALIRRQRVLIVCPKTIALDVVYERLKRSNYEDFIMQVTSFTQDKNFIWDRLVERLNYLTLVRDSQTNLDLDRTLLRRSLNDYSNTIENVQSQLEDFKAIFFDTQEFGISIKQLYLSSNPEDPYLNFKSYYHLFRFDTGKKFLKIIETYWYYYQRIEAVNHAWQGRRSFANFDIHDYTQIKAILVNIPLEIQEAFDKIETLITMQVDLDDITWIKEHESQFKTLLEILRQNDFFVYFKKYRNLKFFNPAWLVAYKKRFENSFKGASVEQSLDKKDLVYALTLIQKAQRLWGNWFYRLWWQLTNKEYKYIINLLKKNQLLTNAAALKVLAERIENRMNFEHYYTQFAAYHWLLHLPKDRDWGNLNKWFEKHFVVLKAKVIYEKLRNGIRYINLDLLDFESFEAKIKQLFIAVNTLSQKQKQWQKYLINSQISTLSQSPTYQKQLIQGLEDFEYLVEYDNFKAKRTTTELTILDLLTAHCKKDAAALKNLFQNSLYIAWINYIENKYPVLKIVSSGMMEQLEQELQTAINQKRRLSKQLAFLNIHNNIRTAVMDYDRLQMAYIDLYQRLKLQKLSGLRSLFADFEQELLMLLPCWLVTPDSVSAIWNMKPLFDLVIFDEASQCFVEKSLPILYRARQCIIIGDEQQLPPQNIYKTYWQDPDCQNDSLLSLLDLGLKYLPYLSLQNHFRSKDLALIQFSNRYFYKNKLRLLPDYHFLKRPDTAIEYCLIEHGRWQNQTNLAEAQAVVDLLTKLVQQDKTSIAVISFNKVQKELIEHLLKTQKVYVPPSIMLKNIENVQGDERDIVIFSIAYGINQKGKFYGHFGSLNTSKGANRLNVAITRAREKIYIITSILPSQIEADDASSLGLRYLKDYLHYAWRIHHRKEKLTLQADTSLKGSWYLRDKIEQYDFKTLKVIKRLPFADLLVQKGEDSFLLLTDDDFYYSHTSVLQTHGFLPLFFKQKHWQFKTVYTRNYWKNKANFWNDLENVTLTE